MKRYQGKLEKFIILIAGIRKKEGERPLSIFRIQPLNHMGSNLLP